MKTITKELEDNISLLSDKANYYETLNSFLVRENELLRIILGKNIGVDLELNKRLEYIGD